MFELFLRMQDDAYPNISTSGDIQGIWRGCFRKDSVAYFLRVGIRTLTLLKINIYQGIWSGEISWSKATRIGRGNDN